MIAVSAHPPRASSQFGSTLTKASRLHSLFAFVFAGLASTVATSPQAHYTIQTLAATATEKRTEQTACGTNRLGGQALQYNAKGRIAAIATAGATSNTASTYSYQYNSRAQRLLKTDLRKGTTATAVTSTEATLYADDATGSTLLGQYSNQRNTHSAAPAGEADSTEVLWLF